MLDLAELLFPVGVEAFHGDFDDTKPLHIPAVAGGSKAELLDWEQLSALINQTGRWTSNDLRLIINGHTVSPEQYCSQRQTLTGAVARPSAAKIRPLLAMGASLILNHAETLTPALRRTSRALAEAFAGKVGVNLYCSFAGVHAFDAHYDPHHVFAVQLEGRKHWRLYENRAVEPIDMPSDVASARSVFRAEHGGISQVVEMGPGDVLYIPRGWYHDAYTPDGASLHATFSVTPLHGRGFFRVLESVALRDPTFRSWLAPAWREDAGQLTDQLSRMGQQLNRLMASPGFEAEIAMAQRRLVPQAAEVQLPEPISMTRYNVTGLMPPKTAGERQVVTDWLVTQRQVVLEDMIAQFDFLEEGEVRAAVLEAERSGVLTRART